MVIRFLYVHFCPLLLQVCVSVLNQNERIKQSDGLVGCSSCRNEWLSIAVLRCALNTAAGLVRTKERKKCFFLHAYETYGGSNGAWV